MELQLPRPKLQNIYTVVVRDAENKEELARYEMHNTAQNDKAFYYNDNSQTSLKLAILCGGEYYSVGDYLSVKNLYTNDTNESNNNIQSSMG